MPPAAAPLNVTLTKESAETFVASRMPTPPLSASSSQAYRLFQAMVSPPYGRMHCPVVSVPTCSDRTETEMLYERFAQSPLHVYGLKTTCRYDWLYNE